MRKISKDGILLCTLQAETFEKSVEKMDTSSEIFIRRFMKQKDLTMNLFLKAIFRQTIF